MLEHQSIGKRSLNSFPNDAHWCDSAKLPWFCLSNSWLGNWCGRCDESLKCFVLAEAVVRTGEGLPDHSRSEAVLLALLDLVNDVLKIPGGPRKPGQLEPEQAEPNLVLAGAAAIKHHLEDHPAGCTPVPKGLGEARLVIAPQIQLEVVALVVTDIIGVRTAVGSPLSQSG